jgi:hypothetical protein
VEHCFQGPARYIPAVPPEESASLSASLLVENEEPLEIKQFTFAK